MTDFSLLSSPLIPLLVAGGIIAVLLFVFYRLQHRSSVASRQAEQQRADAENRFTLAFQHNTVPMCISEWDGTIRDVNQVFCEISGYAPEELVGKNSVALGLWHRPDEQRTLMVALLEQHGRVRNMEVEFHNKAGVIVPTLLSVSLLTIDGKNCLLSTLHDLTAAKEMEEKNRKFEQQMAQTRNLEAMGALVGGLAHQFNNILTGIIGYGELALDDVDADSQTAGDLEKILEKAAEAQQLVQQIPLFQQRAGSGGTADRPCRVCCGCRPRDTAAGAGWPDGGNQICRRRRLGGCRSGQLAAGAPQYLPERHRIHA